MQEELLTGSTCKRNFSLLGSTCMRNFSQDGHARGTSQRINMQEELLTGSKCKRNFSQDQHARGTSHRINMQEELLTESTCKRTFWSAYGCFSLDVKLYHLLSISPILLLSICSFFPLLSTVLLLLYTLYFCCELSRILDLCMIIFIPNYARPKV